jgi:peptidyl-prolyl cis-trans isomerase A (cyclophilin A)
MIRTLFAAALLLSAPALLAQQAEAPPAPPAAPAPVHETVKVRLVTALGDIVLELEKERAPITTANFLKYVDQKRFDGIGFYRALTFPGRPDLGLIQGGLKSDVKKMLPPIAHEPTTRTGLTHKDGAISMARVAPGSAQADFFIILGDLSTLDANPKAAGDNAGFAAFGRVVEGMDVVKKILASPVSATEGVGAMKGQMIEKPVLIRTARREPK